MNYRCHIVALLSIGPAFLPGPASAQQASPDALGAIEGYVGDLENRGLPGVQVVVLDAPRRTARTIAYGAYHIDSLTPGVHLLRFRRLGVAPLTVSVTVRPNEFTSVDVRMETLPQTLPVVTVVTTGGEYLQMPRELAQRIKTGLGHYVTYDDIERRRASRTSDLLTGIAGVQVDGRGHVSSTRGITALLQGAGSGKRSVVAPGCGEGMAIYIDGSRVGVGSQDTPLDLVAPSDILAIEVYRSPVEMSATLPHSPCGAIFVWTKLSG